MSAKGSFIGFSGNKCLLCSLKIYSKKRINITRVNHRQSSRDTVGQSRDVLSLFLSVRPIILLNLYVIIDYFIISLNDLVYAIAFDIVLLAFWKGFR